MRERTAEEREKDLVEFTQIVSQLDPLSLMILKSNADILMARDKISEKTA